MIFLQPLPQTSPSLWSPPPLFVFISKQHKHNMMKSTLSCITRLLFSWMGKQTHRHIFMLCNLCSIHTIFWAVQILLHYFWRALVDTGQRAVFYWYFQLWHFQEFWLIFQPFTSDGYTGPWVLTDILRVCFDFWAVCISAFPPTTMLHACKMWNILHLGICAPTQWFLKTQTC